MSESAAMLPQVWKIQC